MSYRGPFDIPRGIGLNASRAAAREEKREAPSDFNHKSRFCAPWLFAQRRRPVSASFAMQSDFTRRGSIRRLVIDRSMIFHEIGCKGNPLQEASRDGCSIPSLIPSLALQAGIRWYGREDE